MKCAICDKPFDDGGEHVVVHYGDAPDEGPSGAIVIVDNDFTESDSVCCAPCAADASALMVVLVREARAIRNSLAHNDEQRQRSALLLTASLVLGGSKAADTTEEVKLHLVNEDERAFDAFVLMCKMAATHSEEE